MIDDKIEGVSIVRLSDKEKVELPMGDFLKMIIAELPIADKVNDEIQLNKGQVFSISSLQVIEMKRKEGNEENEKSNSNSPSNL